MHLFTLDIREQYGSAFVCKTLDEGISEPLRILLQVDMSVPECPFCHSKNKEIQKNGTRTVIDLFEPDDPNGRLYDDDITNACVVAAQVTYENPTFRCGDCKRLYKIPRPFLSENPKLPFTARTVAMIENWRFNGISLKRIVEKLTEYSESPVSESTVYQLLEGVTANSDLTRCRLMSCWKTKIKAIRGAPWLCCSYEVHNVRVKWNHKWMRWLRNGQICRDFAVQ